MNQKDIEDFRLGDLSIEVESKAQQEVPSDTPVAAETPADRIDALVVAAEVVEEFPSSDVDAVCRSPEFQAWQGRGRQLLREHTRVQLQIAMWLLEGAAQFGRIAYREAAALTGYSPGTLRDIVWVVRSVPAMSVHPDNPQLSFYHYRAVAHLPPEQQDVWLEQARNLRSSVQQLRNVVKYQKLGAVATAAALASTPPAETGIVVNLPPDQRLALETLAKIRDRTPQQIVAALVRTYLALPEIAEELEDGRAGLTERARVRRLAGYQRWLGGVIESVNRLLVEYEDDPLDPADFVAEWERRSGRRLPFYFVRKNTEFNAHYGKKCSPEDAGTKR